MARRTANPLTPEAHDVLARVTIDGQTVILPPGQLDRRVYVEVDETLRRIGGTWNRKAKGHVFTTDPAAALAEIQGTGVMPADADKAASFWRTPDGIADQLVGLVLPGIRDPQNTVLEPSAGDGAIIRAWKRAAPSQPLVAVEPDPGRYWQMLDDLAPADWGYHATFEHWAASTSGAGAEVEGVAMNPPFTLPERPNAWAEHFLLAWEHLAPGAVIACVAPDTSKGTGPIGGVMRCVLGEGDGDVITLPPDAFRESGTAVRTVILTARKPS